MDLKGGIWLVAPLVKNLSCSHPRYAGKFINHIGPGDTIQAFLVICLTIGVVGANLMVIFVINSRRYSSYIHPQVNHFNFFFSFLLSLTNNLFFQPRYLLTSLALNDLAIGLLITPFGVLPALFHCWPYGEIFCQIQVSFNYFFCIENKSSLKKVKNIKTKLHENNCINKVFQFGNFPTQLDRKNGSD